MRNRYFRLAITFLFILTFLVCFPLTAEEKAKEIDLKGFSEWVKKLMAEEKVPGMAVGIVKDGKVIFAEGFGVRGIKEKKPVTPNTLFAIGSTSKAFTAATAGILVDQGKLDWDTPVREYLPSFKLKDPFASEGMTPRDLMCHRSGLPRHDFAWINSSWPREKLFHAMRHLKPSQPFRTVWQYQNFMFMTAGYLVGQVAGTTWEKFTQKHIFDPLGMTHSNFSVEDSKKSPDFALPHGEKDDQVEEIPFRNIDAIGPAGSINSCINDMTKWIILNLSKGKYGEKQIISEASLKEIHSPQMIVSKSIREKELFYGLYGMGWGITAYRGNLYISHGGGIDGFITQVALLPNENAGMVVLSNKSPNALSGIIANNIADRILGLEPVDWYGRYKKQRDEAEKEREKQKAEKDTDRVMNTTPSHPLQDYVGDYENPGYGVFNIVKDGDSLKGTYDDMELEFKHYHYDTFELSNEMFEGFGVSLKATFYADKKGNIVKVAVPLEGSVSDIVFTRLPDKAMSDPEFLKKFVGIYILEEGEEKSEGRVYLRGETTLIISVPGAPREFELVPYKGTEFTLKDMSGFSAEFIVDESGAVTAIKFKTPGGVMEAKKK